MTFPLDHVVINVLFDMDRAAALMSQLGFTVTPEVRYAMRDLAGLLAPPKVSAERIQGELTKLLLSPLPGGPAATRISVGAKVTWTAAQMRPPRTDFGGSGRCMG